MKIKVVKHGFITKLLFASDPASVEKHKDQVWTTQDGRKLLVCDMDTKHIYNAMRLMTSRAAQQKLFFGLPAETTPEQIASKLNPIYEVMREEIKRRFQPEAPEETKPRRKIRLEDRKDTNQ